MNSEKNITFGNMTDEQIADMKSMGIVFEQPIEEPVEETVEIEIPEESEKPKFIFSFEMMDEEPSEKFVLNALQEAMANVLKQNSKEMARARFYINGKDENGIAYGNFNGAGPRAITMYQPEHPDAPQSGKNYGKVFYRWTDKKVVGLMTAIFEECGWDPQELEGE